MIYNNFCELVGKTPLLRAEGFRAEENIGSELYAKLECFNPAGSVKDRVAVNMLIKQNSEREAKEREAQMQMKAELEKRIPTPQQRMSMRSTKSSPYSMTPNEYMNNYAPDNYSDADDNNGADDMQYKITKDDIDRFTDYNSIMKDLDVEHQGLKDILGF